MEKKESYEITIDEEVTKTPKAKAKAKAKAKESGVPWEQMEFKLDVKKFAKVMNDNNIRTLKDVQADPQTVVRILQSHYGIDLGAILMFAKEHEEA